MASSSENAPMWAPDLTPKIGPLHPHEPIVFFFFLKEEAEPSPIFIKENEAITRSIKSVNFDHLINKHKTPTRILSSSKKASKTFSHLFIYYINKTAKKKDTTFIVNARNSHVNRKNINYLHRWIVRGIDFNV